MMELVKPVLLFKGCPKCRGDVSITHDVWGDYWHCLQCGYIPQDVTEIAAASPEKSAA
ncbi:MAG: hypothetical protein HY683_05145 [Chloroflexi bacterium]|nr:hypothetical protein [Chloroflexota bacterium]